MTNIIYTRVGFCAKVDQDRIIAQQIKRLYRLAKNSNFSISKVIKEQELESNNKRSILRELLQNAESGRLQNILCTGLDRLIRDSSDAVLINKFFDNGVKVITPRGTYGKENISDPTMLVKLAIKQHSAEYYSKIIKRGLREKSLRGGELKNGQ